ncbi:MULTISPECIES: hypothetical protein [Streptomyces]|uniref:Uncharacterized protein n=1 Tax=Streptomyces flaveolus TaxID=67297 RepID=A0ABV3AJW4_9ACTN|nr:MULTISPECIES: hypothetical protein [Streptomyces]
MLPSAMSRLAAVVLCAASLTAAQASPASAAGRVDKKISFSFLREMETSTWNQKRGSTSFTLTRCRSQQTFYAELRRSVFGPDIKLEGHTLKCVKGKRAFFTAPDPGTYYFYLNKLHDGELVEGNATIGYPN